LVPSALNTLRTQDDPEGRFEFSFSPTRADVLRRRSPLR
jgi:hypothetical protein